MFILQWFFIQCICEVLTVKFGGQDQYRFEKLSNIIKQLESQKEMWETDVYSVKEGWYCVIHFLGKNSKGNTESEGLSSTWAVRNFETSCFGGSNSHARDWGTHWFFYDEGVFPPLWQDQCRSSPTEKPRKSWEDSRRCHPFGVKLSFTVLNEEISKTPTPGLLVTRISKCCVHLL